MMYVRKGQRVQKKEHSKYNPDVCGICRKWRMLVAPATLAAFCSSASMIGALIAADGLVIE